MFTKLSAPASEEEITRHWEHTDKVYVSVVCPCFNQENYISDALDSFLAQQLDYKFEIVVHDDASTDSTPDILKDYQRRYPSIIRLILQTENQYSQRKQISSIGVAYAKGDYIALCEGDDFWVDAYKLQKQLTQLVISPSIDLCFTAGYGLYSDGCIKDISKYQSSKKIFNISEVILIGGAGMPTPSLLFKRQVIERMPNWFHAAAPVGDYYIQIMGSAPHGALFIPDQTVCYRINSSGSWSSENSSMSTQSLLNELNIQSVAIKSCLNDIDKGEKSKIVLSNLYYKTAYQVLKCKGDTCKFRDLICESWILLPKLNFTQNVLYSFREFPRLLRLMIALGEKFKKKTQSFKRARISTSKFK